MKNNTSFIMGIIALALAFVMLVCGPFIENDVAYMLVTIGYWALIPVGVVLSIVGLVNG